MTDQAKAGTANILSKLALKWKLILMISVPLLVLGWFSMSDIQTNWRNADQAEAGLELANLSVAMSSLVHELQKERGFSAGFIGSKGAKFSSELPKQRNDADVKAAALKEFLATISLDNYDAELGNYVRDAVNDLDQIGAYRQRISNHDIPGAEAIGYYTGMNGKFLNTVAFLPKLAVSPALTNTATAYANFLLSKERAGIERAVLTGAFSADSLKGALATKFQRLVNEQNSYMSVFQTAATPEANAFYTQTMRDASVDEVMRMRTVASGQDSGFGIDSAYWFKMSTGRINLLKQVENWLAENLIAGTNTFSDQARAALIWSASLTGVALVLSILLATMFTRIILRQLGGEPSNLVTIVDAIAGGDLEMDLSSDHPATGIFSAMQTMQGNLKERQETDQKELENSTRLKSALDRVGTNVLMVDDQHTIIYANDTFIEEFGGLQSTIRKGVPSFSADTLVGSSIDMFFPDAAQQRNVRDGLSATHEAELKIDRLTFRLISNPVFGEDQQRLGTVIEWTDRTQELAAERDVQAVVSNVLDGDLTRRISVEDKAGFFKTLSEGVNGIVIKLADAMLEINQSSSAVQSGATEISQGNTNLSQRTEEQAASLEETASSMTELTQNVRDNAEAAANADKLSSSARDTAEQGGEVVGQAIQAMEEINASSKKIADIIGAIDEIAFQTNLLALNASVEAARAGEQGRGFAVVASEVRNLAGRSANAAKEIKDLIEHSVASVEAGSQLVNASGETLSEIVAGVREVSTIVGEISDASQRSSNGIDEINTAISQMDEMTQQNAALVEEIAAASENMRQQAEGLNEVVAAYQVDPTSRSDKRKVGNEGSPTGVERRGSDRPWSGAQPAAANPSPAGNGEMAAAAVAGGSEGNWQEF